MRDVEDVDRATESAKCRSRCYKKYSERDEFIFYWINLALNFIVTITMEPYKSAWRPLVFTLWVRSEVFALPDRELPLIRLWVLWRIPLLLSPSLLSFYCRLATAVSAAATLQPLLPSTPPLSPFRHLSPHPSPCCCSSSPFSAFPPSGRRPFPPFNHYCCLPSRRCLPFTRHHQLSPCRYSSPTSAAFHRPLPPPVAPRSLSLSHHLPKYILPFRAWVLIPGSLTKPFGSLPPTPSLAYNELNHSSQPFSLGSSRSFTP